MRTTTLSRGRLERLTAAHQYLLGFREVHIFEAHRVVYNGKVRTASHDGFEKIDVLATDALMGTRALQCTTEKQRTKRQRKVQAHNFSDTWAVAVVTGHVDGPTTHLFYYWHVSKVAEGKLTKVWAPYVEHVIPTRELDSIWKEKRRKKQQAKRQRKGLGAQALKEAERRTKNHG